MLLNIMFPCQETFMFIFLVCVLLNTIPTTIISKILIFNVLSYVSQKQFVPFGLTRNVIFVLHLCIIMTCLTVHYHWFTTTPLNSKPNLPNDQRQKSALR